jgi:hypothetical protein
VAPRATDRFPAQHRKLKRGQPLGAVTRYFSIFSSCGIRIMNSNFNVRDRAPLEKPATIAARISLDPARLLEMLQIVMAVTDGPCRVGQATYCR